MIAKIKQIMNNNHTVMCIISFVYNFVHYNNSWMYKKNNTIITKGSFIKNTKFDVNGKNNKIQIGKKARLRNCRFTIIGNNCKIIIGNNHTIITDAHFWCQDDNSTIIIGDDFTMEGGHIASTEGHSITIGNDCMFSNDIEIRNGDSHSIIDTCDNKRINHASNIVIGNHVWLTAHVRVLKGSYIPSNCIIGNSSILTSKFTNENSIYAGVPCKFIKDNINWDRNKL